MVLNSAMSLLSNVFKFLNTTFGKIVIAVALALGLMWYIGNLKDQINVLEEETLKGKHNISVLTDSIHTTKNKLGEVEHTRGLLQTDLKTLKRTNKELYDKLKNASKGNDKPDIFVDADGKLSIDTTVIANNKLVQINDTTYQIEWKHTEADSSHAMSVEGNTRFTAIVKEDSNKVYVTIRPKFTRLTKNEIGFGIMVAYREQTEKKPAEITITPTWNKFRFTQIEGAVLEYKEKEKRKTPSRFSYGVQAGVGAVVTPAGITPGFYTGVGFSYRLN